MSKKQKRNSKCIESLEYYVKRLQEQEQTIQSRLDHIEDLLNVALMEVHNHIIKQQNIAALVEEERQIVQKWAPGPAIETDPDIPAKDTQQPSASPGRTTSRNKSKSKSIQGQST